MKIPFNEPYLGGSELKYIYKTISEGNLSGDGFYTQRCRNFLEKKLKTESVLLTTSGTHALEMAAILSGIGQGDEVLVPSFTFVSTVNAIMRVGAKPVFVDIRPDTKNIDEELLEQKTTAATKAVFLVHYGGVACEMNRVIRFCRRKKIRVVEDAAQAIGAKYEGKYLGTIGDLGCLSFHETKNLMCGEGGALIVNRKSDVARAEIIREKGTDRSKFIRGEVNKYLWRDVGSSYLLSDILAAFLYAQLEKMNVISNLRKNIYERYRQGFQKLAEAGSVELPYVPKTCESNYHMFYLMLPDKKTRDRFIVFLKSKGISATFHYLPLHSSPMGWKLGYRKGDLPVTEKVSGCLVRLPFYNGLSAAQQEYVIRSTHDFFKSAIKNKG